MNIIIIVLSILLIGGFIYLGVVTYNVRNNAQTKFKSKCETCISKANIVHAGSDTGCTPINHTVTLKSLGLIEFKDNNGNILNPNDYDLYLVSGECMQYVDIHPNDLVFATKGFDVEHYNGKLPIILILKKGASAPKNPMFYKLRRLWRVCNYRDNLMEILKSILQSPEFQEVRRRPSYDGDEQLINDFFDTRLKRYETDYINCEYPNASDEKIIISTTFHTDIEKVRFSIHPISNIVGKVIAAFPIDKKYIEIEN